LVVTIHEKTVSNEYLGVTETIKGAYPAEVGVKAEAQLAMWAGLEKRRKERDAIQSLSTLAEYDSGQAREFLEERENILRANLNACGKLNWVSLYNDEPYPPFVFKEPPPRYDQIAREMGVPQKSFFTELFFPSARKRRLKLEQEAKEVFDDQMRQYEARKEAARTAHEERRDDYVRKQSEYNQSVDQLQFDFEKGLPEAVESCLRIALAGLTHPDIFNLEFDTQYNREEKLAVVNCLMPVPEEAPRTVKYIYNEEEYDIIPVEMEQKEFNNLYESILLQLTLAGIRVAFDAAPARLVRQVAFNGLVKGTVPETGGDANICILTCKVSRDRFDSQDLTRCPPAEIFTDLPGVMTPPMTELNPVQPVVDIDRTPPLYSEVEQILGAKPETYQPGDFKHIARELVSDMFDQIEKDLIDLGRLPKRVAH